MLPGRIARHPLLLAALLIAAIVAAYASSLRGGFLWDDDLHITANPTIIGPLGLKEIWTTARANYFPLVLTNFWVQHELWGLEPFGYRVVTLSFHVLAAILLWRVLLRLGVPGAWLGAALWALHPVQVESAAWICELKNTQSAVFFLASIWCYLVWLRLPAADESSARRARGYYAGALLCAILALLSKPSTVMLPVALGLCTWWVRGRLARRDVLALAPFFLLSALVSGWTIWEQKYHSGALGPEWDQGLAERIAIAGRIVWFYLGKLLWPEPLIFIYPRWSIDPRNALSYLPVLAVLLVLAVFWLKRDRGMRPLLFAALYFGALLFPVLGFFNVYFFRYSFVGDHFQYLASIGPLALIAAGVARLPARATLVISSIFIVALGILTWRHAHTFRDMETLWRSTVALNPGSKMAWLNLGDTYSKQRRSEEAIAAFRRGLEVAPNDAPGHNDLGCELVLLNRVEEALPHLQRAVELKPVAEHLANLGNALRKLGRVAEAIDVYQRALQLDPNHAAAHNNLGAELADAGKYEEALRHFETALRVRPGDAATHENMGNALLRLGRPADAKSHYETALRLDPARALARKMLADVLVTEGRTEEAFALLTAGVAAAPRSAEALNNLGAALAQAGRLPEAIARFEEALRLGPDSAATHLNLGTALGASGKWTEAARHFQTAVTQRPEVPEAHAQLAVALVNSGRLEDAVAPFRDALRLRPGAVELHNNFAQLLRALGRNREAFEHFEEAARLQRESGPARTR